MDSCDPGGTDQAVMEQQTGAASLFHQAVRETGRGRGSDASAPLPSLFLVQPVERPPVSRHHLAESLLAPVEYKHRMVG